MIYLTDAFLLGKSDIATRRERLRQRREILLVARCRLREGAENLDALEGSKSEERYGLFSFPLESSPSLKFDCLVQGSSRRATQSHQADAHDASILISDYLPH